jgi:hypothetical protein
MSLREKEISTPACTAEERPCKDIRRWLPTSQEDSESTIPHLLDF